MVSFRCELKTKFICLVLPSFPPCLFSPLTWLLLYCNKTPEPRRLAEEFIRACSFRRWAQDYVGSMALGRQAWHYSCSWELTSPTDTRQKGLTRNSMNFWNLEAHSWWNTFSNKEHHLILSKQFHQLGTKHSKPRAYEGCPCSNHHTSLLKNLPGSI